MIGRKEYEEHVGKTVSGFENIKEDVKQLHDRINRQRDVMEKLVELLKEDVLTKKQLEQQISNSTVGDELDKIYLKI